MSYRCDLDMLFSYHILIPISIIYLYKIYCRCIKSVLVYQSIHEFLVLFNFSSLIYWFWLQNPIFRINDNGSWKISKLQPLWTNDIVIGMCSEALWCDTIHNTLQFALLFAESIDTTFTKLSVSALLKWSVCVKYEIHCTFKYQQYFFFFIVVQLAFI